MKASKGDFIEISYTARIKGNNVVFDTTEESVAKENNFYSKDYIYKPAIICLGSKELIPGLDNFLVDKDVGVEYEVEFKPKEAFGEKNPRLYQLVSTSKFLNQKIRPYPGLQVNIDNTFGTVKTVSGGRTMVDFNHPLAGKEIVYKVKISRIITDPKEKIKSYLEKMTGNSLDFEFNDNKLTIMQKVDKDIQKLIAEQLKKVISEIESVDFKESPENKKVDNKKQISL